jgi:hypothetical protein
MKALKFLIFKDSLLKKEILFVRSELKNLELINL